MVHPIRHSLNKKMSVLPSLHSELSSYESHTSPWQFKNGHVNIYITEVFLHNNVILFRLRFQICKKEIWKRLHFSIGTWMPQSLLNMFLCLFWEVRKFYFHSISHFFAVSLVTKYVFVFTPSILPNGKKKMAFLSCCLEWISRL